MTRLRLKLSSVDTHTGLAAAKVCFAGRNPMLFSPEATA